MLLRLKLRYKSRLRSNKLKCLRHWKKKLRLKLKKKKIQKNKKNKTKNNQSI